ncbi:MAG: acetoacetate metabolism regulatory protein AtoC [Pyrinomonadaceae bacterium]|nr:MAG: acetoacetate metabolism regulatory protein AtoC [Pyrinomonadaceae bacterium]
MAEKKPKILIADDDDSLRRVLEFQLSEAGYKVETAADGAQALELFSKTKFDCVITDWRMPAVSGLEVLRRANTINSETPVIIITAFGDVETAVQALRGGAFDFITKPFDRQVILSTIQKALKYGSALAEKRRLRALAHNDSYPENIIGNSEKIKQVLAIINRVAKTNATVLIQGESGTGKELVAKTIHLLSERKGKPFIAINCAAIPETLIEAELFGYKKGAFTGAISESKGKFEEANGGTLFLDEVSAMPLSSQTKLLRVLQEHEITRLGENLPRKINVRVIASTNEDLSELIKQNRFREDLYYRLAVVPITLPPLRKRREDIPLLAEHFLQKITQKHGIKPVKITQEVLEIFNSYSWPGNVRELENVIERMVILSDKEILTLDDVPEHIKNEQSRRLWFELPEEPINLEALECEILRETLKRFGGNQSQAARYLGITRSALIYRMKKYGLE